MFGRAHNNSDVGRRGTPTPQTLILESDIPFDPKNSDHVKRKSSDDRVLANKLHLRAELFPTNGCPSTIN